VKDYQEAMVMLEKRMEEALNGQVNAELFASYLYYSASAYFESMKFPGFAHWMRAQAMEEVGHAQRIYDHIVKSGGRVTLRQVDGPPTEWPSPLAVIEAAYGHEVKVTGMIHGLVELATEIGDTKTHGFLQWFVEEQEEEEEQTDELVNRIKAMGDSRDDLLVLDGEVGAREIKAFWK